MLPNICSHLSLTTSTAPSMDSSAMERDELRRHPLHGHTDTSMGECRICGDEIGLKENGDVFVACHDCRFPVCRPCYEYERSDGRQTCPQCCSRYKHHKGSPRVPEDEDDDDLSDFEDEFPTKSKETSDQRDVNDQSGKGYRQQQRHLPAFSSFGATGGYSSKQSDGLAEKDVKYGEKETNSDMEWKERIKDWKARQEKRGLVNKQDDPNGDDEDDIL